ncbi:MAG: carbohydrate kinase family protein [Candidatus Daviesbacteria bacterium]|nr:carbohydrate kinase family protein [Candidatus Daviesbacteria bacterium]
MFDLISIGDAVIDTFVPLTDAHVHLDQNLKELCLRYGDKIPVGDSVTQVAGNACNSAVGASRLKLNTSAYINVGGDADGQRIKDHLKDENVDIRYVVTNKDLPSNHHVVLNYKGERTILIFHQPWKYHLPDLEKSRWVYFTSLSPTFADSNIVEELTNYLERFGARMLYNPGTFQIKLGVKKNPRLLSLTEVFIVNLEEAKIILGHSEGADLPVKKLLQGICDLGPKITVITDGGKGSYGFDGQNYYHMPIFPAKLVEMTGSGDAFATGLLAGLFYGKDLPETMRWGAANGASVVEQIGPQAGLLTYSRMQERLKENKKILANKI